MSKITKALEKASRERQQRLQQQATVTADAVALPIEPTTGVGEVAYAEHVHADPHLVAATTPDSPIAEQYRILKTNLLSGHRRAGATVLVLTSAVHGEGKSVTSLNLALTLARQERLRVLLIDADLRRGSIHRWLGLGECQDGLSTVLRDGGRLNGSLVRLKEPPLVILPAGPTLTQPTELLESSAMKRLLAAARTQFDLVLLDAPPVLPVADPGILGAQADGVLLVVQAGKTQRKTVIQAQTLLKQMKAEVLGCVLTHVEYYLAGYHRYYLQYRYSAKAEPTPTPSRDATVAAG